MGPYRLEPDKRLKDAQILAVGSISHLPFICIKKTQFSYKGITEQREASPGKAKPAHCTFQHLVRVCSAKIKSVSKFTETSKLAARISNESDT